MKAGVSIALMIVATGVARSSVLLAALLVALSLVVMSRSDTAAESGLLGLALLATLAVLVLGVPT